MRRAGHADRAIQIAGAATAFLLTYATLTVLHAAGHEPTQLDALSSIPLFRRILASLIAAGPTGWALKGRLSHPARAFQLMRWVLAGAVGVAVMLVLVFA